MTETQPSFTSRYALAFIFITMLVDTIGLGIVIPVTPRLISELTGEGLSGAARWGGLLFFLFALMQFFFSPMFGNLSDRYGRRPVLILSLLVLGLDYFISGIAPTIAWLIVARVTAGIASSTYPTVNAYIADVSPPEKRAANFGLTGAAFGIGFVLGPAIGGVVGNHFGSRAPFFVAAAVAIGNALFGLLVLKESLPPERRRTFELWRANPVGSLIAIRRYPMIFGLIGVLVLTQLAHDALPATWTFYVMERFHWNPAQVGYSLMAVGVLTSFTFAVLPRLVIPLLGEVNAVYAGFFAAACGYAGYAFSSEPWMLYAWMIVWALAGVGSPALNSILSRQVPADEQGELQGALGSLSSLTSVFAPVVMTNLFSYFTGGHAPVYFPGASFLAAALCELGALAIFFTVHNRLRVEPVEASV
ncbi:MAG TPA: TCR/Tet family MFS transporter [Rhizomicrobium sp.]|jgi:DHA1 family tetracycline resistance protein-like MFS transporter